MMGMAAANKSGADERREGTERQRRTSCRKRDRMQRFIISAMVVIALFTVGVVGSQSGLVGTAWADGGDGGGE